MLLDHLFEFSVAYWLIIDDNCGFIRIILQGALGKIREVKHEVFFELDWSLRLFPDVHNFCGDLLLKSDEDRKLCRIYSSIHCSS